MTVMISEEFGHGNFGAIQLSDEEARKFACLVRKRYEHRTSQPVGLHVRWHDMLASFMQSLRNGPGATLVLPVLGPQGEPAAALLPQGSREIRDVGPPGLRRVPAVACWPP